MLPQAMAWNKKREHDCALAWGCLLGVSYELFYLFEV
jgi:hypothetical protein